MPASTATRGFNTIVAMANESTYNTEVATTRKLRHVSSNVDKKFSFIEPEELLGVASPSQPDQGTAEVTGELVTIWDYTLADTLFARFLGSVTDDVYTLDDVLDDQGFTLAVGKRVEEFVFTGCKASKLVIAGAPGQAMTCTWTLFPNDRVLGSSLNTQAVLNALADPSVPRVLFHHLVNNFLIGDLANDLASGDRVKVDSWSLTIDRGMKQFHANSQSPEQAREDGFQMVSLEFSTPLYQDNFFVDAHAAHTPLQSSSTFVRSSAEKIWRLPIMYVEEAPTPVEGPGLVTRKVTLKCYNNIANDNDNTDMTFDQIAQLSEA